MQTVRLGRTNVEVSVAGLGCGGHSRLGMTSGASADEAAAIVSHALDLGITFIDTARAYGTEEAVGKGLAGRRDEAFISTKAHTNKGRWGGDDDLFTAQDLADSLELSLKRLATDRVDLFNLHGVTPAQYPHCRDVLVPELKRLQGQGKIRFLGITEQFGADTTHAMLADALADDFPFDVTMVGFNLVNPSARERVFPGTMKADVGTLIMFAVRRALSQPDALKAAVADLIAKGEIDAASVNAEDPLDFVREHPDVTSVVEAAYRFCRHEPGCDVILTGTGKAAHLTENVGSILAPPLPRELSERLAAIFGRVTSFSGN